MGVRNPLFNMPRLVSTGGLNKHSAATRVLASADDTHTNGIAVGGFVIASTNGYITVAPASDTSAAYQVQSILDAQGRALPCQYVTAAEANASNYYLEVIPVGGCEFELPEDALVTPITDAAILAGYYADMTVAEPTTTKDVNPFGTPQQVWRIDSDSANSSSSNLIIQLISLGQCLNNPYSATAAASPRVLRFKFITAAKSL